MKKILLTVILLIFFTACDKEKKETYPEPEKWKTYTLHNSALINNYVNCVAVDHNDHVWVGNYYGDVTEFDGTGWTHHTTKDSGISYSTIRKIVVDHENNIWVGSEYGLFRFENGVWIGSSPPVDPMYTSSVGDIAVGADNSIWVCSRPLWRYYRESLSSYTWFPYSWSQYSYAFRIAVAPNGDLWMITGNQMIFFDGTNFTTYSPLKSGLYVGDIQAVAIGKNNHPWIGTYYNGLAVFNGSNWTFYDTENSGLPDNHVRVIAFDRYGRMWIGTLGGLVLYDGAEWKVYTTENSGLLSNYITGIAFDSKGNIWIATYGGGLSVFNPDGL